MQSVETIIKSVYVRAVRAADKLGVKPSAVSNWKAAGYFPSWAALAVYKDAQAIGVELDLADIPSAPTRADA